MSLRDSSRCLNCELAIVDCTFLNAVEKRYRQAKPKDQLILLI